MTNDAPALCDSVATSPITMVQPAKNIAPTRKSWVWSKTPPLYGGRLQPLTISTPRYKPTISAGPTVPSRFVWELADAVPSGRRISDRPATSMASDRRAFRGHSPSVELSRRDLAGGEQRSRHCHHLAIKKPRHLTIKVTEKHPGFLCKSLARKSGRRPGSIRALTDRQDLA